MNNQARTQVFVTQEVPTVDYTPAAKWGDIVFVTGSNDKLSPIQGSLNNKVVIDKIKRVLEGFNHGDLLICSGSPAIMAIASAVIGDKLAKVLSWDGRSGSYFEVYTGMGQFNKPMKNDDYDPSSPNGWD